MIVVLVGLMGSGKSYEAVNFRIIPALKSGRKVITNIPLNIDYIVSVLGEDVRDLIVVLEPEEDDKGNIINIPFSMQDHLKDDWKHPIKKFGALFVIDEAQIPMPARQTDFNRFALEYATMQRHRGHDWILISQDPSLIYQPLIKLATTTHQYQKCTNIGRMDQYRHFVLDGSGAKSDFILEKTTKKYDKKKFKFYKSHTASDGAVEEQNITGSFFNLKRLFIMLILGILLTIGYIVWYAMYYLPNRYNVDVVEEVQLIDNHVREDELPKKIMLPPSTPKILFKNIDAENKSSESISIAPVDRVVVIRDVVRSVEDYKVAPYDGFQFHIIGSMTLHKKTSDVFYGVWSAQGVQDQLSRTDLIKIGYTITILNRCTHLFDHKYLKSAFYVTCHAPQFEEKKDKKSNEKKNPNNSMTVEAADKISENITQDVK